MGDACTGTEVLCGDNGLGPWWSVIFFYGHGQFSTKLYDQIVDTCGMSQLSNDYWIYCWYQGCFPRQIYTSL